MPRFEHASLIDAPVDVVFGFHELPDALDRLLPPGSGARVLERSGGLEPGARVVLELPIGPFRTTWVARHTAYEKGRLFVDEIERGPLRRWRHEHRFEPVGARTRLTDAVEFSLPGGALADAAAGWAVRLALRAMFRRRHAVTRRWCEAEAARSAGSHAAPG